VTFEEREQIQVCSLFFVFTIPAVSAYTPYILWSSRKKVPHWPARLKKASFVIAIYGTVNHQKGGEVKTKRF
jgi:hypothetical protein